ncbi:MAG: hypothetical protein CVU00_07970 [Bacteroidetes bacterium HGW-Bacteroidetes-17]|nr:MAG: hypothetical protein CVU00_07970 [Bacteroidetes bacterium HGW-Bacteroidetes-17]
MKKILSFYLLLFCCFIIAKTQNLPLRFQHLTPKDGLSQAFISGIIQDKYGFIWIGTQDGLNRYDGYDFKIFSHDPSDPHSISDSYVLCLFIDSNENLWIGTESGLNRYDFTTERFIHHENHGSDSIPLNNTNKNINVIAQSKTDPNLLWLGTNHGLSSFDMTTNKFTNYIHQNRNPIEQNPRAINAIYTSNTELGMIWIGTSNGLLRINSVSNDLRLFTIKDGLSRNNITSIYEDTQHNIWIGTDKGLNLYDKASNRFTSYETIPEDNHSIGGNLITSIFEDSYQHLWIGVDGGGLNLYDRETKNFTRWINQPGNPISLSDNGVRKIFEDRSGILWIGATVLNKTNTNNANFGYFYHDLNNPNSLISNEIRSILLDNNHLLWIGTQAGISIFDKKTGKYTHLLHNPNNPNSISSNIIRVVFQDKTGNIWIGTRDAGISKYDPQTKIFKHYRKNNLSNDGLSNNNIRAIFEDINGMIWIGTVSGGLNRLDPKTDKFRCYNYEEGNSNSLNDNRVYSIIGNKNGELWIGTGNGVAKFDPKKEIFDRYIPDPTNENSLSHHLIMGVTEDHSGNIWVGTYGGGLNKIEPLSRKITRFNEPDGLVNNVVYGIIEDNEYNLWMSTNRGLSKLDPRNKQFTNFGVEDGLQEGEFNSGAYYKSIDGDIYFGGINGVNVFKPENLIQKKYIPPVLISDFQLFNKSISPFDSINGKPILQKSIIITDTIKLTHRENIFSFSFTALDYTYTENNQYAYILENFEKEWNRLGTRRHATYTNLPAGEYTFKVIGSSSNGIWNEEGRSIKIIIIPPWWKTKIFYILFFTTILLLIIIIFRIRISQLKKDKLKLEKYVEERTNEIHQKNIILEENQSILQAQKNKIQENIVALKESNATKDKFFSIIAHDLKNPFNSILGFADILNTEYDVFDDLQRKRMINEIDKTSKSTFDLLENLLTWSRSQSGKIAINKEYIKIKELIISCINPYLPNAKAKNISIIEDIDDNISFYADKYTFSNIIGNLVNNAIKFTHVGGEIKISITETNTHQQLIVEDNGVGIGQDDIDKLFRIDESHSTPGTNNEQGTGLGLLLCKEFIEMNNGNISVESGIGKGSRFTISLPRKDNY